MCVCAIRFSLRLLLLVLWHNLIIPLYIRFSFIHLFICRSSHFFMLFNIFMYFGIFGFVFFRCVLRMSFGFPQTAWHSFCSPFHCFILMWSRFEAARLPLCVYVHCVYVYAWEMHGKSWAFHHHWKLFFTLVGILHTTLWEIEKSEMLLPEWLLLRLSFPRTLCVCAFVPWECVCGCVVKDEYIIFIHEAVNICMHSLSAYIFHRWKWMQVFVFFFYLVLLFGLIWF